MTGSFHEVFTVDLPSQTTIYTGAETCASPVPATVAAAASRSQHGIEEEAGPGGRAIPPADGRDRPTVNVVARLATEHHAVELVAYHYPAGSGIGGGVEFDALAKRLPRAAAGGGGHRRNRASHAQAAGEGGGDRTCVAHSVLPVHRHGAGAGDAAGDGTDPGAAAAAAALGRSSSSSVSAVEAFVLRRSPKANDGSGGQGGQAQHAPRGEGGADGTATASAAAASGQESSDHPRQSSSHDDAKAGGHQRQGSASRFSDVASLSLDPSTATSAAAEDAQSSEQHRLGGGGGSNHASAEEFLVIRGPASLLTPHARNAVGSVAAAGDCGKAEDERARRDDRAADHAGVAVCAVPLPYQPLVVRVSDIILDDGTQAVVGVFVGSADDARLRLYMPKQRVIGGNNNLAYGGAVDDRVDFAEIDASSSSSLERGSGVNGDGRSAGDVLNLLSLSSPVMSVDVLAVRGNEEKEGEIQKKGINYLAVGCQDGTVRVVSYTCRNLTSTDVASMDGKQCSQYALTVVGTTTAVVDGPIVTMHLSSSLVGACFRPVVSQLVSFPTVGLVVGSLCGFACSFLQVDGPEGMFDGPDAIVTDLWSGRLDAEDSVLCVCSFSFGGTEAGSAVAIGTYSGRIIVFEPQAVYDELANASHNIVGYEPFWSCQLPYPVHGISSADLDGDGLPELLVTTRKGLHIFRGDAEDFVIASRKRIEKFFIGRKQGRERQ